MTINKVEDIAQIITHGDLSQNEALKMLGMHHVTFKRKTPEQEYKKVQKKLFKNRTGDISRVIKVAKLYSEDYNFSEISKVVSADRTTVRTDIMKRLLELYNIYNYSNEVRNRLNECGITSYKELEVLFNMLAPKISKIVLKDVERKQRIKQMTNYIIRSFEDKNKIVTLKDVERNFKSDEFKITQKKIAEYIKGMLFYIDSKKYEKVMNIYGGKHKFNSYFNKLD